MRQLETEAAEKNRIEREGLVVLRLKMANLFAKQESILAQMSNPVGNIKSKYFSDTKVTVLKF